MVPFEACVGRAELLEETALLEEELLEEELLDEVLSVEELLLDRTELAELPGVIDTLLDLLPPPPPPQAVRVTAKPMLNSRPFKVTGFFIHAPKL